MGLGCEFAKQESRCAGDRKMKQGDEMEGSVANDSHPTCSR
jgi:hypothetical protein